MRDVFILGIYGTSVGRFPDLDPKTLTRLAYVGAMEDAGLEDRSAIGGVWYGNMMMDYWGQPYTKGQLCMAPLVDDGLLPKGTPVINVEGACATGSLAFNGAINAIRSGQCEVAAALGVEKMYDANKPQNVLKCIEKAMDWLDPESWQTLYQRTAAADGGEFQPNEDRSIMMDIYAMLTRSHSQRYGTTPEHLAAAASKNHSNSVHNPRAQYQFPLSIDEVLNDRTVSDPLTRAMCAPVGDGAAAVFVCSSKYLAHCSSAVKNRAVRVVSHELATGVFGATWEDDRAPVIAARKAFNSAGLSTKDIDVVELHDATSFAEIHLLEDIGFCGRGEGGPYAASGATAIGGEVAVNPSGGLVSRGHPMGATGIMMLNEICIQLRNEAVGYQVKDARIGLAENGGGIIGLDAAVCSVAILEAPQ